jgi:hypothetical protein
MLTNEPTNQQTKLTAKYSTNKPTNQTKPNQTKPNQIKEASYQQTFAYYIRRLNIY